MLVGERGVGKTRLAKEAAESSAGDMDVEWMIATESAASLPLAPFVRLVPDGASDTTVSAVFARIITTLRERASSGPGLLLVVDDAHLLDEASAALLLQLTRCAGFRLLLTARAGVPVPDALAALWKEEILERIELQALGLHDTVVLLETVLDGQVDRTTAERIWRTTTGNALHLRELVDDLVRSGALHRAGEVWRWDGDLLPGTRLGDLVQHRVGRLVGADRSLVELLALTGPLESALLFRIHEEATVLRLEAESFVTVRPDGRRSVIELVHPLYGAVLRAMMTATRRAVLSRQLADAARTTTRRPGDLVRAVIWALDAGRTVPGPRLIAAAEEANALASHDIAERLAQLALTDDATGSARLVLGEALLHQSRFAESEDVLRNVVDVRDGVLRARIASARARALQRVSDDPDAATDVLRAAEQSIGDQRWRDILRAERAVLLAESGDTVAAGRLVSDLMEDSTADVPARLRALGAVGRVWAVSGQASRAHAVAAGLAHDAAAHRVHLPRAQEWVFHVAATALLSLGELDAAEWLVANSEPTNHRPADGRRAHHDLVRARVLLFRGMPESASAVLRQGVSALDQGDTGGWRPWALALLAEARAAAGDVSGARDAVDAAEAAHTGAARLFVADIGRARAWANAAAGELTSARGLLLDVAARCRDTGEVVVEAHALHDALRFGGAPDVVGRLAALRCTEGVWAAVFADHARALVEHDGSALDAVAGRFEAIGAMRHAAEAAAAAASAHHRAGLRSRASTSSARTRSLMARGEGARVPVLSIESIEGPALSRREQEVAGLVAQGLSNRDIADRLFVSVRTVEGHLYRMYAKLGVNDRRQLAELGSPAPTNA